MQATASTGAPAVRRIGQAPRTARIAAETWLLIAIIAVGAVLRFTTIASQSYWVDEATTVHEVRLSLGAMLHAVSTGESTPPLYFCLAWIWAKIFGTGAVALRSLSALAGIGLIPVTYLCGRELVSRSAGIVAAALVAVSPFMVWYSQEARAYMLFTLLCGLSLLFFARARREPSTANVALWTVFSGLALLTHFFAGFLVAPEALWLLYVHRTRALALGAAVLVVVQAALLPLAISDASHPLQGWITLFPLSVRVEQVPTAFALSTLYQSPAVNYGLVTAAVLAGVVALLLLFGAERHARRGAAAAAVMAAVVILAPLVLAEFGHDYYIARNLMPAWVPLAVLIGAACAAPRTVAVGAPLAALLLGAFVYAGIKIDTDTQYQRPDWQQVAVALGRPLATRAITAYDGRAAAAPLSIYLPGVSWTPPPQQAPVTVGELDIVGNVWQTLARPLPAGTTLLSSKPVRGYLVDRFLLRPAWHLLPSAIAVRAERLLGPAPAGASVLIQPGSA